MKLVWLVFNWYETDFETGFETGFEIGLGGLGWFRRFGWIGWLKGDKRLLDANNNKNGRSYWQTSSGKQCVPIANQAKYTIGRHGND